MVCLSNSDFSVFSAICERILKTANRARVIDYFKVLKGEKNIADMGLNTVIADHHTWVRAKNWANWWLQENNLSEFEKTSLPFGLVAERAGYF